MNYGDLFAALARTLPDDAPALVHNGAVTSWGDMSRRGNNLARGFLEAGAATGDKVAFYLRNHAAYMETLAACFAARMTHVNINYRYVEDELLYILDNSDAVVVVYDAEFREQVESLRPRAPGVKLWLQLGGEGRPDFAEDFDEVASHGDGSELDIERAGDDMIFLYTGGTTGMPKGVMWEHQNHWLANGQGISSSPDRKTPPASAEEHAANVAAKGGGRRSYPACPQMHGTGLFISLTALTNGGVVVTTDTPRFDPVDAWTVVERDKVNVMAVVGDAFCKPLLSVLEESPCRFDLSSLRHVISSGVMWSPEVKAGLLRHHDGLVLMDTFGASEAMGVGSSTTTKDADAKVAKFRLGPNVKVFTEDHEEVQPGSGESGFVAKAGGIPSGYYKDPEKTAKTFPLINGVRYSIPGDWCQVEADGTLTLLGRGSVCINTAGEKVYPEEVEEALKTHQNVEDALVVGVPDEKWGQSVTGVVQLGDTESFDEAQLREHVRKSLAGYKCPKRILVIDTIGRANNGKADYKRLTQFAKDELGLA